MYDLNLFAADLVPATLDQILYGKLRPWLNPDLTEQYYERLYEREKEQFTDFPFSFDFDFFPYHDGKTKYYDRVIRKQVNLEVPRFVQLIGKDQENLPLRLDYALKHCLDSRLRRIGKLIKHYGYSPDYLDCDSPSFHQYPAQAANAYAIHMLGCAYAKIYLEVQEYFSKWVKEMVKPEVVYSYIIGIPTKQVPIHRLSRPRPLNGREINGKDKSREDPFSTDSFRYIYFGRYEGKLEDAWDCLLKNGLIARETSRNDFLRVFSGKPVDTPVKWLGFTCDLYYFILLLHARKKLIRNLKKKVWEVTCKCFVRADGSPFDRHEFPNSQTPRMNKACIEAVVGLLV